MKRYTLEFYRDGVTLTATVAAKNEHDALQILHDQEGIDQRCWEHAGFKYTGFSVDFKELGLGLGQRIAIAYGNADYADEEVCRTCEGRGYVSAI